MCHSLQKQNIQDFQVIDNFVANSAYVFITELYDKSEKLGTHHQKHKRGENDDFMTDSCLCIHYGDLEYIKNI